MGQTVSRFAPTTSGRAHPGTLLAYLLSWLDARSRGAKFMLRLEDIDPSSTRPEYNNLLLKDLDWFGLDYDELSYQSKHTESHHEALDTLGELGLLYECDCSRSQIARFGLKSKSGGFVYSGTCRSRVLKGREWRRAKGSVRLNTDGMVKVPFDEGGLDLAQNLSRDMGDPLLARPDKSVTYMLAVVVDDLRAGVNRIVRGHDIAPSTATQVALWNLLGQKEPVYRHHFLFLEPQGSKLAKLHQSISVEKLSQHYSGQELARLIAGFAGLGTFDNSPQDLVASFAWNEVPKADITLSFNGDRGRLELVGPVS